MPAAQAYAPPGFGGLGLIYKDGSVTTTVLDILSIQNHRLHPLFPLKYNM